MKTISIGDTHGLDVLTTINNIVYKYDKVIFVGDYVDSFYIDDVVIRQNLLDIIEFKRANPDKVVLLLGNHDVQYLLGYAKHGCSGYRPSMTYYLHSIFKDNIKLFQLAYQIKDTIWTHAGIHEGWYRFRFKPFTEEFPELTLAEQLNIAFSREYDAIFDVGYRRGGMYDIGGPLWCDANELKSSPVRGYNQIVGHTHIDYIQKMNLHNKELTFIDVLPHRENTEVELAETLFYYTER